MRSYSACASGVAIPSATFSRDSGCRRVYAAVLAIGKALPTNLLEIGELEVTPGLDVFGDPVGVLVRARTCRCVCRPVDDAALAIVEIDLVRSSTRPMY